LFADRRGEEEKKREKFVTFTIIIPEITHQSNTTIPLQI